MPFLRYFNLKVSTAQLLQIPSFFTDTFNFGVLYTAKIIHMKSLFRAQILKADY